MLFPHAERAVFHISTGFKIFQLKETNSNFQNRSRARMNKISRFVIWLCSKFNREELEKIVKELSDILANRNPDVKPKDDFKQKHPNYRNYFVDPNPPLPAPSKKNKNLTGNNSLKNINKKKNDL